MNATQFGEKYGKKYVRKIPKWYKAGYLGNTTKDAKTGIYSIPDDIPLPYSAHSNVSQIPTLWKEILEAAEQTQSIFASMYPKLPSGVFNRQLNNLVEAGFVQISYTFSGNQYLELQPAGFEYMQKLSDDDKKVILTKANSLIVTGCTVVQAFFTVWPYIQPFLTH